VAVGIAPGPSGGTGGVLSKVHALASLLAGRPTGFFASDDALLLAARLLDPHHLRFMGCGPRVARPVRNLGPPVESSSIGAQRSDVVEGTYRHRGSAQALAPANRQTTGKPGRVPASWAGRTGGFAFGRPKNKRRPHARYSLFFTIGQTEPEHSGAFRQFVPKATRLSSRVAFSGEPVDVMNVSPAYVTSSHADTLRQRRDQAFRAV
jgi:hypothetical protein